MEHHDATGVHQVSIKIGQEELVLETGKMAKQANGSVFARLGGSAVIATACAAENEKEDLDFIPLSVDYLEKYYAAGKIPGGFIKRESRPSDKATLTARQIDRPIRPSFPKGFMNEVQIIGTVLSFDQEYAYDVLTMTGASAALTLSEIPFLGPLAAVRVGLIDGEYVVNPLLSQLEGATPAAATPS
jgi:polyribonucleotide nucleotidyltransferase